MILFELLVIKGLLAEFLTLLGLMVLVQTCVGPIDILLGRRWATPARRDSLRVEGALPELHVIFEGFQAF